MTKNKTFILMLFAAALPGCASIKDAPDVYPIAFDFHWTEKSGCAFLSPPMVFSGVPESAGFLRLTMVDLDKPSYSHGGGVVPYVKGMKGLSEGVLSAYEGPCPPTGAHKYKITIEALNKDQSLVLARGSEIKNFPQ